jgi:hypothetical protein
MSAIFFLEKSFTGDNRIFNVGSYSKNTLRDVFQLTDVIIQSIKVDRNTILLLSSQIYPTQSGDTRVIIGPTDINDINSLNMKIINSLSILRFRESNWGEGGYVTIFSNHNFSGKEKYLYNGEYNSNRLATRENNIIGINPNEIKSMLINTNTIVILYTDDDFKNNTKSVVIKGPIMLAELSRFSMEGAIRSIRIYSEDITPNNLQPNYSNNWNNKLLLNRGIYTDFNGKNNERFYNVNIDGINMYNPRIDNSYNPRIDNINTSINRHETQYYPSYGSNNEYNNYILPMKKNIMLPILRPYLANSKNKYKIIIILLLILTIIVSTIIIIIKSSLHKNKYYN